LHVALKERARTESKLESVRKKYYNTMALTRLFIKRLELAIEVRDKALRQAKKKVRK